MAKKKQKKGPEGKGAGKGGKGRAADTARLPKRIAGVKVPKKLRAPGGRLLEAVSHPLVMDIAAAALMAAAARLRDETGKSAAGPGSRGKAPGEAAPDIGAILAATAVEGLRKIAEATRSGSKGNGAGGQDKEGGGS